MQCQGCTEQLQDGQQKWHSDACRKRAEGVLAAGLNPKWIARVLGQRRSGAFSLEELARMLKRAENDGFDRGWETALERERTPEVAAVEAAARRLEYADREQALLGAVMNDPPYGARVKAGDNGRRHENRPAENVW